MIVRRLLAWLESADSTGRAKAAAALARAYLSDELERGDLLDAETAMTALLDDPALCVRKAMARELATSADAPAHVVAALATDHSSVAARVLTHSPLLSEDDLIDCLGVADGYAQVAIALRPGLSGRIAAAVAETGCRESIIALAVNDTAALDETIMMRMIERHGADGEAREALLGRPDIPVTVRAAIARQTASALQAFVTRTGWLSEQRSNRACRDGRDTATIELAARERTESADDAPLRLALYLRQTSQLTPSLLLRALVCADRSLFEASLVVLSGVNSRRVGGLLRAWSGPGFGALYARAGLPASLLGAFRAALAAQDATGLIFESGTAPKLSGLLIERTLRACEANGSPEMRKVSALLHRLRAEAARTDARAVTREIMASAKAMPGAPDMAGQIAAPDKAAASVPGAAPAVHIDLEAIAAEISAAPEIMAA